MSGVNALKADHVSLATSGRKSPLVVAWQPARPAAPVGTAGTGADATAHALSAAHPTLGKLTEQSRRALLRWSRFRAMKRRETVWHQGDPAGAVILVVNGYLKRSTPLPDGNEVLLGLIGPGGCAGETAVLLEQPHDANLTALSECLVLTIDARQFRHAFGLEPEALLAVMRSTTEELRRTTQQLLDGRAQTTPGRLAKVLLCLPRAPSSGPGEATRLGLRLSQSELGAMAGICREVVNRYLGIWRDAGWIELSDGRVTSFDMAAIFDLSREEPFASPGTGPGSRGHKDEWHLRMQTASK
jgi:CRP/FNR family transcriptional regulator, cyclic AMP receptor protein